MKSKFLYIAIAIYSLSIGILITVVPLYIKSMDVDGAIAGFIFSAYAITFVMASPIWGKMSDVWGRKITLVLGMAGYSLAVLLYSFVKAPSRILPIRLLQGFADAAYWTVPAALIADIYAPEKLGKALGKIGVFQGIGSIAGPLVGGILIREYSFPVAFYFCSALTFLTALLVFFGVQIRKKPSKSITISSSVWLDFDSKRKKSFAIAYFDSMLPAIYLGIIAAIFPLHADTVLEGNTFLVGLLLTSYYVAALLIKPLAGKLSDIIGRRLAILVALATSGLGFFILIFSSSFLSFLLAMIIVGTGVGQLSITSKTALMDLAPPSQRGFISGLQSIAWGIGYFFGPMIGGVLADYSLSAPYIFCTLISTLGGFITLVYDVPKR
ncbi:MAG: MFS transporter [Candidatus Bathyarchaeota archaeon]|nr:MAG: MFS transporter [Candidatus Bathyarchaeota archaeon]